jgi:enoyl-CoA hydratase/carnithine racemase
VFVFQTLGELIKALRALDENPLVKIILLSSSGAKFCNGLDLRELLLTNPTDRKAVAQAIANSVS